MPRVSHSRTFVALSLVALLVACAGPTAESGTSTPTAAPASATAATSVVPSATAASAEASATAEPSATAIANVEHTIDWTVPFTMTAPADWEASEDTTEGALDVKAELQIVMAMFRKEGETPEDWIERLTTAEALDATEPQPAEVGGASGHVLDVRVNETAPECDSLGARQCFVMHQDPDNLVWIAEIDRPMRVWILDVNGETVLITTDAREDRFEDWVSGVEEVISTLEWQES